MSKKIKKRKMPKTVKAYNGILSAIKKAYGNKYDFEIEQLNKLLSEKNLDK